MRRLNFGVKGYKLSTQTLAINKPIFVEITYDRSSDYFNDIFIFIQNESKYAILLFSFLKKFL